MEVDAQTFHLWAIAIVAIVSMVVAPLTQWAVMRLQLKYQSENTGRQLESQAAIARRQIADSIASKRQAWIDGLRSEIASFLAVGQNAYDQSQERKLLGDADQSVDQLNASIRELVQEAALLRLKIELRMNATEDRHNLLSNVLDEFFIIVDRACEGMEPKQDSLRASRRKCVEQARRVLKYEWERVKSGEL